MIKISKGIADKEEEICESNGAALMADAVLEASIVAFQRELLHRGCCGTP